MTADRQADYRRALESTYGSVLTRALPGPVHACATCRGAAGNDYKFCPACNGRYGQGKTPRLGFCLYAVKGAQLYRSLFAYKESGEARYVQDARQLIRGVLYFAFADHYRCLEAQEGSVDAWCIVPSLRPTANTKSVDHALSRIASSVIGDRLPELNLWTTPGEGKRVYQPERLHLVHTPDADRARHVLLIEDTWVTGSNACSAAEALFREGIEKVSILTIARLVDSGYAPAQPLVDRIRDLANTPDSMWACPWTRSGNCPTIR